VPTDADEHPCPVLPRAFLLDFDGVIVDSAELKTAAFADIYRSEAPDKLAEIIAFQLRHGGVSRRLKFEHFERRILLREPSISKLDELCHRFAGLVVG
jgi:phosphoglycolate phosphatase